MNKHRRLIAENVNEWKEVNGAKQTIVSWSKKNNCPDFWDSKYFMDDKRAITKEQWLSDRIELGFINPFSSPEEDEAWADAERRMDTIGQNGNTAEHYDEPPEREKYGTYHKDVRRLDSIDVYETHRLFSIDDPSGCLQHASKKLLLSGVRTGGKTKLQDIEEARDTLNRWVEMERGV
jgi:hypothetical protein